MLAPAALAVPVDSAALAAQVPEEPAVPVRARLRQLVPAGLLRVAVPLSVQWAVLLQRPAPVVPLLEERRALADLVPAVPVDLLLSRPSFSAAMARSTPSPAPTFEPVPR